MNLGEFLSDPGEFKCELNCELKSGEQIGRTNREDKPDDKSGGHIGRTHREGKFVLPGHRSGGQIWLSGKSSRNRGRINREDKSEETARAGIFYRIAFN